MSSAPGFRRLYQRITRRYHVPVLFCCILVNLLAASGLWSQVLPDWENPRVFERNQVAPHAVIVPFSTPESAMKNERSECPFYLSLNGSWKFRWLEKPDDVPDGFFKPDFEASGWDDIAVPSNWEMMGFGHPKFRNISLTFFSDPPRVPKDYNPVGCYRRRFTVPEEWHGREVFLRFEGIKSASWLWINGEEVGYNEGGFEPAEFKVTRYLRSGENEIAVKVFRYSDGSYMENQDMWRLSGIYRDVWLYAKPTVHFGDYYVVTDLDADYRDAMLNIELQLANTADSQVRGLGIRAQLWDAQQNQVLSTSLLATDIGVEGRESKEIKLTTPVANPGKWSAEKPVLYTLLLELQQENGTVLEAFSTRVGFREMETIDGAICVNGVPVKFNGVNSHMHHPLYGQAVPLETMLTDLRLMKQFNINLVRTSHYPPSPEYLDLADELGVYVVDETGDECHDNIHLSGNPEWRDVFVDRARKLVMRDRNHASVVFWSAGNEAGWGDNLKAAIEEGKRLDPSRPAWMYGGNRFYIPFEDITGPRYWIPIRLRNLAEGKVLGANDKRPSFMDEYLAATGNSVGGLDEYWDLIYKYRRLSGGAIWDWISPGITAPVKLIPDISGVGNDGAILGPAKVVPGKTGNGIDLSGHDDWVEFYNSKSLDISGSELTIEFWVYPRRLIRDKNNFIMKGDYQFGVIQPHPDSVQFFVGTTRETFWEPSNKYFATAEVPDDWYGKWHHVAGVLGGGEIRLHIDYDKKASAPASGTIQSTPHPLCIGRNAQTQDQGEFSGRLSNAIVDEVRIYPAAIDIAALKSGEAITAGEAVLNIDFEKVAERGEFFSTGLGGRRYGIVWPDRQIQPEIWQIKKSAQPVKVRPVALNSGEVKVINRHHFTNLNELSSSWRLLENGEELQRGELKIDLAPQAETTVKIPFKKTGTRAGREYILELSFALVSDTDWAQAGHIVAWDQMPLPGTTITPTVSDSKKKLALTETAQKFIVRGERFTYGFDRTSGVLSSIKVAGKEVLASGPAMNLWRAPLSNDIDPWGSWYFANPEMLPGNGHGVHNEWLSLGIDSLTHELDELRATQLSENTVEVKATVFSFARNGNSAFENHFSYTIDGDGLIKVHHKVVPHGPMPTYLPKVGLQLQLPAPFTNLKWYGRGPFENYPDRKTGAKIGLYESTVDAEYVPYLMPQDHGNKTDVRWLAIADDKKAGLMVRGESLLSFSAHAYATENLTRAQYPFQLKKADFVTLNLDYEVSGVGDTATRTLMKYRVLPRALENIIYIRPFDSSNGNPESPKE